MVTSVVRGTSAVSFAYGPERARYRRQDIAPSGTTTTLYVAGGGILLARRCTAEGAPDRDVQAR